MEMNALAAGGYGQVRYTASYSKNVETESVWGEKRSMLPDNGEERAAQTMTTKNKTASEYYYEMQGTTEFAEPARPKASTEVTDQEAVNTQSLGIGFVLTKGNMGYGMSAGLVLDPDSEDTLVRVRVALGGGASKTYEVNINEVDPRSATAIEMFAFCQYRDACGEGVNSTFGSWNALKTMIDPTGGLEFDSLEDAATKKMNWDSALARSSVSLEKRMTGETLSAADLLQMLREAYNRTNSEDEEKDWRTMSEEEWEKLLDSVDKQLETLREAAREDIEKAKETEEMPDILDEAELLTARSRSYTTRGSYTDPETGDTITTENHYRAFITENGVTGESTRYHSKKGATEGESWEVPFEDEETYERAIALMDQIPEEDETFFAVNERFWKDFTAGEIDEKEFLDYYNTLDHGKFFIKTDENGNNIFDRDMMTSKYARYFSVPLGQVFTLEEIQHMWDSEIQANQNKKLTTEQMLSSDPMGTKGSYRFAGESRIYDFYDFLEEFERRYGNKRKEA